MLTALASASIDHRNKPDPECAAASLIRPLHWQRRRRDAPQPGDAAFVGAGFAAARATPAHARRDYAAGAVAGGAPLHARPTGGCHAQEKTKRGRPSPALAS